MTYIDGTQEAGDMKYLVTYQWPHEGYGKDDGTIGTQVVWAPSEVAAAWYVRGGFKEEYEPILVDIKVVDG